MTATPTIDGLAAAERKSPETAEELAAALGEANESGKAVVPIGGGTQLDLGLPPSRVDVALETTRLTRVVEYEPADLTVTVEAGMSFADLQRLLAEQSQFLALDPPLESAATIGGVIATNASGPLRFAYGTARDLVIGMRVANADGKLTRSGGRVVKNVAGYDLNKLYVGSLGTLGVIVELSFKLAPLAPATATIVGQFADLAGPRTLVSAVVHSPLSPLAIDVLNPRLAAESGLPRAYLVVFRLGGYREAVDRQQRDLGRLIAEHGGRRVDAPDATWEDLATARQRATRRDVVFKAAAPIAASTTLLAWLESGLRDLNPSLWSHAGSGVAFAACDAPSGARELVALREQVRALGGNASLVVQRCPTVLKGSIDVWGEPGSSLAPMRALKAQLDPRHTLNPGRYVGGL